MTATWATALTGYTLASTDPDQRRLAGHLRQYGAAVVDVPMLRVVPARLDARLRTVTRRLLRDRPDQVVAATATGWRRWMAAAAVWGLSEPLADALAQADVVSTDAEVAAAVLATGLSSSWTCPSGDLAMAVRRPAAGARAPSRVALVVDDPVPPRVLRRLRARHADVDVVPTRRWALPRGLAPVHRLAQLVIQREVHAVAFSTSIVAKALVDVTTRTGRGDLLLSALATDVAVAATDPAAAAPFLERDIPVCSVNRGDAEALARRLTGVLVSRRREFQARGHRVAVQGSALVVDGRTVQLGPRPATVLRLLADDPGRTLSRSAIEQIPPLSGRVGRLGAEHAVWRLRTELGDYGWLVETVARRGYRLAAV